MMKVLDQSVLADITGGCAPFSPNQCPYTMGWSGVGPSYPANMSSVGQDRYNAARASGLSVGGPIATPAIYGAIGGAMGGLATGGIPGAIKGAISGGLAAAAGPAVHQATQGQQN